MKKYFFTCLILGVFCFSSFPVQAILWGSHFVNSCVPDLFQKKKQPPTLLEELNDPEVSIKSTILPNIWGEQVGNDLAPYMPHSRLSEGQAEYSFAYIPAGKRKEKGRVVLLFRINTISGEYHETSDFSHWIHWSSDVAEPHLDANTVRVVFNKVYEEVYGVSLEEMVVRKVIPKAINYIIERALSRFGLYDLFNFNSLLFRNSEDQLKRIIAEVIQSPDQIQTDSQKTTPSLSSLKMTEGMRRLFLSSYSPEELKSFPAEEVKTIELTDLVSFYDTPEKMQTLDMKRLSPEDIVKLLTEYRSWREALTPEQVRQIDVSVPDIQYVFAPIFKHFRHVFRDREALNIDTLSDEQIMNFDRDTFLRDVFLAGDLYVQGPMGRAWDVTQFMIAQQIRVKKQGRDVVMSGSLSKEVHDFILRKLGFHVDFESMTPTQRREVFKAEIKMMTDLKKQMEIIEDLMAVAAVITVNEAVFKKATGKKPL